jgi:HK97 family phage prohead protease
MIKLIAGEFTVDAAAGETPRRTISGTAVPYNVPAVVSDGTAVIFRPGSLPVEGKAPRLFGYHRADMPIGVVTERVDTEQGMMFSAKISATSMGNDFLIMAQDGTIDQVSVGINPTKISYDEAGTMIIEAAEWQELSLVPIGAFGDMANIAKVAASIHQEPEEISNTETQEPIEKETDMSEAGNNPNRANFRTSQKRICIANSRRIHGRLPHRW